MEFEGFDLTLAINDTLEFDSAYDTDDMEVSDPLAMSGRCSLHEGIKVEACTQPHSMRQMVNVILALNRMKIWKTRSTEFGDEELMDMMVDNVIEEHHVSRVQTLPTYIRTKQMLHCTVCDQFSKSLVRKGAELSLQAVTLRSGNSERKVRFNLSTYISPSASEKDSQPVCLAISKSNLFLACTKPENSDLPTLVLKEVNEAIDNIKAGDPNDNLLFFRKETGIDVNTFESVKYRGWFISTALEESKVVEVTQASSSNRYTTFTLQREDQR